MKAGIYHIDCEQGSTLKREFTLKQGGELMDLTGYTARMKIKTDIDDTVAQLEVDTTSGELAIDNDPTTGEITLTLSAAQTDAITTDCVYDIEIESSGGEVTKILKGKFKLYETVTK